MAIFSRSKANKIPASINHDSNSTEPPKIKLTYNGNTNSL